MKTPIALASLFWLFIIPMVSSQTKSEKIKTAMQTYHDFNMFDGSVLVAENGKIIYQGGFGLANREWNIANTPDTKFMIGSVSKPFTAMLVLLQVQKGLINLDKKVSDYVPEFSPANGNKITIRQLLSHTSGMPNYDVIPDFFPMISRRHWTREDYIKIFMDSTLAFEPGTNFNYSSWGYFTLGCILEKVTGKSYAQLMNDDVFSKVGMTSSGSYYHTQVVHKRATGYDYQLGGYASSDFRDQSNTMGTGDLYSTVEDLFRFHVAISNYTLLSKDLTTQMFTPGIRPWEYGFGWFNQYFTYTPKDSVFTNYHLGMTEGFLSFMVRVPETNSLIVYLCNSSPTDFFGINNVLMRILYNKPVRIKQPLHKVMERLIPEQGVPVAIKKYDELKQDTTHYYSEWWNNDQLGHQLYVLKRYDDAFLLFEKNVKEFPKEPTAWISLGQACETLGRIEEAAVNYRQAIAINPNIQAAKNRLKGLENRKKD